MFDDGGVKIPDEILYNEDINNATKTIKAAERKQLEDALYEALWGQTEYPDLTKTKVRFNNDGTLNVDGDDREKSLWYPDVTVTAPAKAYYEKKGSDIGNAILGTTALSAL